MSPQKVLDDIAAILTAANSLKAKEIEIPLLTLTMFTKYVFTLTVDNYKSVRSVSTVVINTLNTETAYLIIP